MAGLNCEIRWETRLCEVDGELGYFHCWEHWSNVIDASPLRGGHPGGQIRQVYGIVEFKDGVPRYGVLFDPLLFLIHHLTLM